MGVLSLRQALDADGPGALAFAQELAKQGFVAGETVEIDYRNARGEPDRLGPLAQGLLALKPGVVLAGEPSAVRAVKQRAADLPIVCPALGEGMTEFFASFSHPGGSVTGIASTVEGMNAKLLQYAAELAPGATRVGVLVNPRDESKGNTYISQLQAAAGPRGLALAVEKATTPQEISPAIDRLAKDGAQAVVVPANALLDDEAGTIAGCAIAARLPTVFQYGDAVKAGALLSYSTDVEANSRHVADFVAKILKGAKPGDLPIEFPTKLVLALNLKTAKSIGVTVPPILIATADTVIE